MSEIYGDRYKESNMTVFELWFGVRCEGDRFRLLLLFEVNENKHLGGSIQQSSHTKLKYNIGGEKSFTVDRLKLNFLVCDTSFLIPCSGEKLQAVLVHLMED